MKRNFGLDVVRTLSIWLVLLQHSGYGIIELGALTIGSVGVEVFFVLSGFLIGGILFRELDKGKNLFQTLKSFWVRRWFRILPLYYLVLLFNYIMVDSSIGWNILYYIFFLQNNFYGVNFLAVSWSLVIEEWFYLTSPIYLFAATRLLKKDQLVLAAIVAFIVGIICLRAFYVYNFDNHFSGVNGQFLVRFDSLFLGVLLACLKYKGWKLFEQLSGLLWFFVGLFISVGYVVYYWQVNRLGEPILDPNLVLIFGFFILPFGISLMIPYCSKITINADRNWLNKSIWFVVTWTSLLTYALYLTHSYIFSKLLHTEAIEEKFVRIVLVWVLTYIASAAVYFLFEKPILRYRDRITGYAKKSRVSIN